MLANLPNTLIVISCSFRIIVCFVILRLIRFIGKRHVYDDLCIIDEREFRLVACSSVVSPFEGHCQLGHPSLPLLKKYCPPFQTIPSLECESYRFAKRHRNSVGPRINNRAKSAFELVHSNVWRPCLVVSKIGHKYFVTFVDDFSRMT